MAAAALTLLNLVVVLAALWGAWRLIKWRNARADLPVALEAGAYAVPVRELRTGTSHNSIWPKLTITPAGIRFKVLLESFWTFAEIEQVDAHRTLFGGAEVLIRAKRGTLTARLADEAATRTLLRALPTMVRMTDRAATLRDAPAG